MTDSKAVATRATTEVADPTPAQILSAAVSNGMEMKVTALGGAA